MAVAVAALCTILITGTVCIWCRHRHSASLTELFML
ncbi:hypothetical protein AB2M75_002378 [Escherichia coli]|nr:hypothetical protein [Escherichia coli]